MHVITQTLQVSHSSIHTTWVVTWAKPKACWRKYHKALRFAKCDLDRKEFQSRWIIKEFLYDLQREKLKSVRRYDGFGWLYWLRTTNITKFNLEENCYYQQTKGKTMHVDILYRHLFCTSVGFFFFHFSKSALSFSRKWRRIHWQQQIFWSLEGLKLDIMDSWEKISEYMPHKLAKSVTYMSQWQKIQC